jgi:adenylate cyclase
MPYEIERKFLVHEDLWRAAAAGPNVRRERFRQGYISLEPGRTVRVRAAGARAWLTLKGERTGLTRYEFEYAVPAADAEAMLEVLCQPPLIEKTRHFVEHAGHTWEVDVFEGENAGLIVAEIELSRADEAFETPAWVAQEVTDEDRYANSRLSQLPYSRW